MKIRHLDHVGIVVSDLEAAKAFFVDLGFTVVGQTTVAANGQGELLG